MQQKDPIVFVTGTDTDVGKTFISTLLVHKWHSNYWKPVQTGIESEKGDTYTLKNFKIASNWEPTTFPPIFEFQKPLCPLNASKFECITQPIAIESFKLPEESTGTPLIIEGAGGAYVPITNKLEITTDLIKHIIRQTKRSVYIIVVARSGLGTLNHTLLTWNHLCSNGLKNNLAGCIVNGPINQMNCNTLEDFGVKIIGQIPILDLSQVSLQKALESFPEMDKLSVS